MRDLLFIGFLGAYFAAGFARPFLFVLTYVYIDIVSPQRLTYYLLNSVPVSLMAVALSVGAWAAVDDKRDVRVAPRQILLLMLLAYCFYTTQYADFPIEAKFKWDWAWKALAFAIFLPLTLRTKLRIEALLLLVVLSTAVIIIPGGLKTAAGGGGYGELNLMVDNNTGLYESSIISAVAISLIPVILWFSKFGTIFPPDWKVKAFCYALIFACLLMPIGTSARTGLLCVGLLAVLMLREVKRPFLYIAAVGVIGLASVPFLPSSFTDRMKTMETYQADASASTRLFVWQWTWDYVKTNPMGGGFDAYRANKIRYEKVELVQEGGQTKVVRSMEIDEGRAYHSAYFEMLGEQGWPGFILWALIHFGGLLRMEILRRRYSRAPPEEAWISPLASALQQCHMIYLLGAVFVGIALNPFIYIIVGAQIGLDTYLGRKRAETSWRPLRKTRPGAPASQGGTTWPASS